MDMQSTSLPPVSLTSVQNQHLLSERLRKWQEDNAGIIGTNQLLNADARAEYDWLLDNLTQCLIAFVGCKVVYAKLPKSQAELDNRLEDGAKLGRWCFWQVDPKYIELIVERLISLRTDHAANAVTAQGFNAFDLISFKIPISTMGNGFEDKVWTCEENIAQVRNQETSAGSLILTALSSNQKNEDTAAEFAKILTSDLYSFNADVLIEFANAYSISVNGDSKFILNRYEHACLDAMLNVLKGDEDISFGLNKIASYASAVLINYKAESSDDAKSTTNMRYALGCAIQALNLPRNTGLFDSSFFGTGLTKRYATQFTKLFAQQSNFENKKYDDDTFLDWYKMDTSLHKLVGAEQNQAEDAEPVDIEPVFSTEEVELIRDFIDKVQADQDSFLQSYHQLCFIDWTNKLEQLFETKTKPRRQKLSERTLMLFDKLSKQEAPQEHEDANDINPLLSSQDYQAIDLVDTKPNKLTDEERAQIENFVNAHRSELEKDSKIYNELSRLSCKQLFECTDFVVGFNQMLMSLMSDQFDLDRIELTLDGFKDADYFISAHNYDMCYYFSIMYGPLLNKLCNIYPGKFVLNMPTGGNLENAPNPLFDFGGFYVFCADQGNITGKPCLSESSEKLQMKFVLSLFYKNGQSKLIKNSGTLIWTMSPETIGMHLHDDLESILQAKEPLNCVFLRNKFSLLGHLHSLNLKDLSTFFSDACITAGNFIPKEANKAAPAKTGDDAKAEKLTSIQLSTEERSLQKKFFNKLSELSGEAESNDFLNFGSDGSDFYDVIRTDFEELCKLYLHTIESMLHGKLSLSDTKKLMAKQSELQLKLMSEGNTSPDYAELVQLVLSFGLAYDRQILSESEEEFAVVTPFHIQSMHNHMLGLERICDFIGRMLTQIMFLDKRKVVLNALTDPQNSMLGPELVISKDVSKQKVLHAVQHANGYTLYQSVSLDNALNQSGTKSKRKSDYFNLRDFFNNSEEQINSAIELLERYVRTHPQVQEHFNILIYNCDNLDLLDNLYTKLSKNKFFEMVKTHLYVVNQNQVALSDDYQGFESLMRSKGTPDVSIEGNLSLCFMSMGEVSALQSKLELKHETIKADANKICLFDVGLIFHACDSLASFELSNMKICLSVQQDALINSKSNFPSYQNDDKNSKLLLLSPEQPLSSIVYLHALHFMLNRRLNENDINKLSKLLQEQVAQSAGGAELIFVDTPVPCYKLSLEESSQAAKLLDYAHGVSDEVITFDTMLDRKQFSSLGIHLVEYRRAAQGNTSTFVSARNTTPQGIEFLKDIIKELKGRDSEKNLRKIQDEALKLSGGLLMHAQIAEIYTNEMMGLVLTRHLLDVMLKHLDSPSSVIGFIEQHGISQNKTAKQLSLQLASPGSKPAQEIKHASPVVLMLDEYASWFGSKTGEIADLLGLVLCKQNDGRYLLRIFVMESKFFKDNVKTAANKSKRQTQATADSFFAICSHDNIMCTLDRELRLKQLVQLLFKDPPKSAAPEKVFEIKQALQSGKCDISVTAISCLYQYGDAEPSSSKEVTVGCFEFGSTDHSNLTFKPQGIQLLFSPKATQDLLKELLSGGNDYTSSQQMLLELDEYREFLDFQFTVALDAEPDPNIKIKQAKSLQNSTALTDSPTPVKATSAPVTENTGTKEKPTAEKAGNTIGAGDDSNTANAEPTSEAATNETAPADPVADTTIIKDKPIDIETGNTIAAGAGDDSNAADAELTSEATTNEPAPTSEPTQDNSIPMDSGEDSTVSTPAQAPSKTVKPRAAASALDLIKSLNLDVKKESSSEQEMAKLNLITADNNLSDAERQELEGYFDRHANFKQIMLSEHDLYNEEIGKRKQWAAQLQTKLQKAFSELGLTPEITGCYLNPNGAVYKFKGNQNFLGSKVLKNKDKLLSIYSIVLVSAIDAPGEVEVTIKYDNQPRIAIPFLSIFKQRTFNYEMLPNANGELQKGFNSKFLMGLKDSDGQLAYFDLKTSAPHTLIAGGSGSGKSNVLNVLLLDMALTNQPKDLEMILMDPKNGAELGIFSHLPHVTEVVYDKERALEVLQSNVDEMNARYTLFNNFSNNLGAFARINDLLSLNKKLPEEGRLSRKVIVIDEFADWFQDKDFKSKALNLIRSLAAKARAAGIHLILATQRPDKDVVDPQLRSNLGNQIALKTQNVNNSKIILGSSVGDEYNAAHLLGKGHMICYFEGNNDNKPFYAQASFISNENIGRIIESIIKDNA